MDSPSCGIAIIHAVCTSSLAMSLDVAFRSKGRLEPGQCVYPQLGAELQRTLMLFRAVL